MQKRILLLLTLLSLSGCTSTDFGPNVYGCADVNGYFTSSEGRLLKLPPDTELTEGLIEALCPHG